MCAYRRVEPGEAIGIHLPLKLLRHLKLGLAPQFPGNNFASPFANAVGDIVAGYVEGLAIVGNAPNEDVGVGVQREPSPPPVATGCAPRFRPGSTRSDP